MGATIGSTSVAGGEKEKSAEEEGKKDNESRKRVGEANEKRPKPFFEVIAEIVEVEVRGWSIVVPCDEAASQPDSGHDGADDRDE